MNIMDMSDNAQLKNVLINIDKVENLLEQKINNQFELELDNESIKEFEKILENPTILELRYSATCVDNKAQNFCLGSNLNNFTKIFNKTKILDCVKNNIDLSQFANIIDDDDVQVEIVFNLGYIDSDEHKENVRLAENLSKQYNLKLPQDYKTDIRECEYFIKNNVANILKSLNNSLDIKDKEKY